MARSPVSGARAFVRPLRSQSRASAHPTATASGRLVEGRAAPGAAHSRGDVGSLTRWQLQDTARGLLPGERIGICHRVIDDRAGEGVPVMVGARAGKERAWFRHLLRCGSVWNCPVCAAKIAEHREEELQAGIDNNIKAGGGVVLVTLTYRHAAGDPLAESLAAFSADLRRLKSGRAFEQLRKSFAVMGEARALEVTHGANGWHPHSHAVTFTRERIEENMPSAPQFRDVEGARVRWTIGRGHRAENIASEENSTIKKHRLTQLKRRLFVLWYSARWKGERLPKRPAFFHTARARRAWREQIKARARHLPSYAHGVDVRGAKYAAAYVAKWGFAAELTKAHVKKGSKAGRTPWQLLGAAHDGDRRAAWLFREFAQVFKGRNQLFWSRGLREALGLKGELTDQQVMELEPEENYEVARLSRDVWTLVVKAKARGTVLDLAVRCRHELEGMLEQLRRDAVERYGSDGSFARVLWFREGLADYLRRPEPSPLLTIEEVSQCG